MQRTGSARLNLSTMSTDEIFRSKRDQIGDFDFGQETAAVFDDMLDRSVPFYAEIQRMMGEIAADFAAPGTRLYDLGCSTGTTLLELDRVVAPEVAFIGVDSSADMLDRARQKLVGLTRPCDLLCGDLDHGVEIDGASVVVMNLTLQFVRPLRRDRLLRDIAAGIERHGCLLLVEKVLGQDSTLNRLFIKYYYDFKKRNGYSDMEISQKREALENVLIPYRFEENRELLLRNGFSACEEFFRWYNFCGMLAIK